LLLNASGKERELGSISVHFVFGSLLNVILLMPVVAADSPPPPLLLHLFSFFIIIKKYFYPMASVLSDPRQKIGYMAPVLKQPRHKTGYMASGDNRGQKGYLLASPQYASVPDPRQNVENNRGRKPLLH